MKRIAKTIAAVLIISLVLSILPTTAASAAVRMNASKKTLTVGKTYTLKVSGTSSKVTWKSSNKKVATVSAAGKVSAVAPGTATITATVGKKEYSCTVTVKKSGLSVHMLDIGQGDAILIQVNNQNILIDTGEEKYYDKLNEQLSFFKVSSIDKLVLTHPDSDHIGAADLVIEKYKVKSVYMPRFVNSSREYTELMNAIKAAKLSPIFPEEGDEIPLGSGVTAKVLSVDAEEDSNGASIVIRLDYYKNSFLFTGDATAKVENTVMEKYDVDVDVLKVSHHGSDSSSPILYLKTVSPQYALISCGIDNNYGHPNKTVIRRLEKYAENILRTDESGTISIKSDGDNLTMTTEHIVTWDTPAPEEETEITPTPTQTPQGGTRMVIGNKNSHVYHYPTCSTLPLEKNRVYFSSAEEAEAAGYHLCGRE